MESFWALLRRGYTGRSTTCLYRVGSAIVEWAKAVSQATMQPPRDPTPPPSPILSDAAAIRSDIIRLDERMSALIETTQAIKAMLSAIIVDNSPDNYDKTPEQIRDIILNNYELGIPFYPSDVADDHGLDYDSVVQAMDMLRKEGRIRDGS